MDRYCDRCGLELALYQVKCPHCDYERQEPKHVEKPEVIVYNKEEKILRLAN
jgi:hypothetical protein